MSGLSVTAQAGIYGTVAAGITMFGATETGITDRGRLTTAGMATLFGVASALSGFKVWAAINGGVAVGALGAIAAARDGSDPRGLGRPIIPRATTAPGSSPHIPASLLPPAPPVPGQGLAPQQLLAVERLRALTTESAPPIPGAAPP